MIEHLPLAQVARALVVAGACCLVNLPAVADQQSDRIQALEKRLENSIELIEKLSARISELERGAKDKPVAASAPAAQAQAIATLQDSVSQLSDSLSKRSSDTGLPVHGFADVDAGWSSHADPSKLRGFTGGTMDLYLTPQFGQRVKSLVEIALEYDPEGALGVDMERLQLGYTVSDAVTVWFGRFHTPFGLWNTSFHHGANLQTSISRPRFIDFEDKGGIIPAHSVGAWATGRTGLGGGRITYDAYLANGPRIKDRTLDFNAFTDDNSNKMLGGNLGYQPSGALSGLTLGVHGFGSTVNTYNNDTPATVMHATKLRMAGAYFGYDADDWESFGEYYRFSNTDENAGADHSSTAWFAQVGKTLGSYTPFVRYEHVSLDPNDNYFITQQAGRSYKRTAFGLRYALDPRASFKLELSHTDEDAVTQIDETGAPAPFAGGSYRRAMFQYSVAF